MRKSLRTKVLERAHERALTHRRAPSLWQLPPAMARLVLEEGLELGDADDRVMGTLNSKQKGGTVGALTGGLITRAGYYEHAFVLAAMPFVEGTGPGLF